MSKISDYSGYGAFTIALIATLSSLIASEVFDLVPCELCWYQRVFMYPLAVIIGVGIIKRDRNWVLSTLILGGIGWVIAFYHSLLQWGVIPETLAPCTAGLSCATPEIDPWLGFITIPLMSLLSFTTILTLTLITRNGGQNEQRI